MDERDDPQGREEIPTALIAACERLCSSRPPSMVSVRDIAEEARVTTGLVHHYFESKDALVAATLRAMSLDIGQLAREVFDQTGDLGEVTRAVWRFGLIRPAFTMIASWWLLEGRNVTEAMGEHPFVRVLASALGAPAREQATTDTGIIVSLILGGSVLRVGVNRALDRDGGDQRLVESMESVIIEYARSAQGGAMRQGAE